MKSTQNLLLTERKVCKISSVVFATAQPYPIGIERLQRAANSTRDSTEACLKPFLDALHNSAILRCRRNISCRAFWKLYWHRTQSVKKNIKKRQQNMSIARMQLHDSNWNKSHEETQKDKQKQDMTRPTPANAPRVATLEIQICTLGWTFYLTPENALCSSGAHDTESTTMTGAPCCAPTFLFLGENPWEVNRKPIWRKNKSGRMKQPPNDSPDSGPQWDWWR